MPLLTSILSALFRNTALVSTIGVVELLNVADRIQQQNFRTFELFTAAGILYLSLTLPLAYASGKAGALGSEGAMNIAILADAGWEPFGLWPIWHFLLLGLGLSLQIAGISILLSVAIGIAMAMGRLAPLRGVRWLAATYVEVFRATPLLLLLFFVFFGSARTSVKLDAMTSAIVALTLYNSAVVAEIVRAGINSISKGILEAGRALGLSYMQFDAVRRRPDGAPAHVTGTSYRRL